MVSLRDSKLYCGFQELHQRTAASTNQDEVSRALQGGREGVRSRKHEGQDDQACDQ